MTKLRIVIATVVYTLCAVAAFYNMPLNPAKAEMPTRVFFSMIWPLPALVHGLVVTLGGRGYLEGTTP